MNYLETLKNRSRLKPAFALAYIRDNWIVFVPLIIVGYLVVVPIGFLINLSFREGTLIAPGGLTFASYTYAARLGIFWESLGNTVLLAAVGSVGTVGIALLFAFIIERTDLPWRNLVWVAIILPLAIPGIFGTLGLVMAFSPFIGWANLALRVPLEWIGIDLIKGPFNIYSLGGLIFLDVLGGVTIVFLMLVGPMRMMDPALEDAAAVSGFNPRTTFLRVNVPMLVPALLAAYIYSFISSMDSFEAALVAGLPAGIFLLPTLIYFTVQLTPPIDYVLGATFSVFFMTIMLVLVVYYQRVIRVSLRYATVTGRGYRPNRISLGWWRWPALAVIVMYLILEVVLPLAILGYASLLPRMMPPSAAAFSLMSLDTYRAVLSEPGLLRALKNTLLLAFLAPTFVMILALVVSWIIVRRKSMTERAVLDSMVFLPHAIPGIIIAVALIILYLTPPLNAVPIYGSLFIIGLGLVIGFLPFTTRIMNGAVIQIHRELDEASYVSGVTRLRTLLHVTLPLLAPAFVAGWILAAVRSMRSFSTPLLLGGPGNEVLAIRMWGYWEDGLIPETGVVGMLFVAMAAPLALFARRFLVRVGRLQE